MTTKERVLALLEQHRGQRLSGAGIARALSVSRNAVWKAVNALRAEGCQIQAVTNGGYCLCADDDTLTAQSIAALLPAESAEYAARITVYPELDSTNRTAKELALAGAAHGTAVIAQTQTGGRGRYTRSFFSPPGGLYMSVVLLPERLHFSQITAVTAFAANAVSDAVFAVTGRMPGIKWVNDLMLDGRKICGILTEAVTDLESGTPGWIVLGIGVNVQTKPAEFPAELREIAGSLYPEGDASGARSRLAAEILKRLLTAPPQEAEIFRTYRSRLTVLGRQVTVIQGSNTFSAAAEELDDAGHLLVRTADGTLHTLCSGEIRILP